LYAAAAAAALPWHLRARGCRAKPDYVDLAAGVAWLAELAIGGVALNVADFVQTTSKGHRRR